MTNTKPLRCPSCGAATPVSEGVATATCEYCGTLLAIERSGGEAIAKPLEQIADAISTTTDQTTATLKTLQLRQERLELSSLLSDAQRRLDNLEGELRALQRNKRTRTTKHQMQAIQAKLPSVRAEVVRLRGEIKRIDDTLIPSPELPSQRKEEGLAPTRKKQTARPILPQGVVSTSLRVIGGGIGAVVIGFVVSCIATFVCGAIGVSLEDRGVDTSESMIYSVLLLFAMFGFPVLIALPIFVYIINPRFWNSLIKRLVIAVFKKGEKEQPSLKTGAQDKSTSGES